MMMKKWWILPFLLLLSAAKPYKKPSQKESADLAISADSSVPSTEYVHKWVPFPEIQGKFLLSRESASPSIFGTIDVVIFVATWCVKCQQILPEIEKLTSQYANHGFRFLYVFSHDLEQDVQEFLQVYHIPDTLMANDPLLKIFHNPEVPSIYVSDRKGWMVARFIQASSRDLSALKTLLSYLSST
jgi:thiol-disulfide isomerase/thioredoxin